MAPERFFLELTPPSELLRTAPHVVIVGGGFAGLRAAHVLAGKTIRVTLIDRRNFNLFQPLLYHCLLYTSPSPRDVEESRMPSSA